MSVPIVERFGQKLKHAEFAPILSLAAQIESEETENPNNRDAALINFLYDMGEIDQEWHLTEGRVLLVTEDLEELAPYTAHIDALRTEWNVLRAKVSRDDAEDVARVFCPV